MKIIGFYENHNYLFRMSMRGANTNIGLNGLISHWVYMWGHVYISDKWYATVLTLLYMFYILHVIRQHVDTLTGGVRIQPLALHASLLQIHDFAESFSKVLYGLTEYGLNIKVPWKFFYNIFDKYLQLNSFHENKEKN